MARRSRGRDVCGIVLLDKPRGLTSNQALQRVKRIFQAAKAGHTGSLDPLATGMLPICFGAATKLSGYLLDARKSYAVVAELGAATDTGDAEGAIVARSEAAPVDAATVRAALESFLGEHDQIPPMYSALKREGRPLYELARQGVVVERAARRVRIDAIVLDTFRWPECGFSVTCSKGTYVRTLVMDLAAKLGTLGHVTALRRLTVGPFGEDLMLDMDALERMADEGLDALDALLLPTDSGLAGWPRIALDDEQARRLAQGQRLTADPDWPLGLVCLDEPRAGFMGIGEVSGEGELASRRLFVS